jgi:hypothetical protein
MSVGNQASAATVSQILTDLTVGLRDLNQQAVTLNGWINGQGNGLAYLQQLGFASEANTENPGSQSDAEYALQVVDYLGTVSGVFFGTANQPSNFNFASAFAPLCAGKIA